MYRSVNKLSRRILEKLELAILEVEEWNMDYMSRFCISLGDSRLVNSLTTLIASVQYNTSCHASFQEGSDRSQVSRAYGAIWRWSQWTPTGTLLRILPESAQSLMQLMRSRAWTKSGPNWVAQVFMASQLQEIVEERRHVRGCRRSSLQSWHVALVFSLKNFLFPTVL